MTILKSVLFIYQAHLLSSKSKFRVYIVMDTEFIAHVVVFDIATGPKYDSRHKLLVELWAAVW